MKVKPQNVRKFTEEKKKPKNISMLSQYVGKIRNSLAKLFKSRWIGLFLGPLYGLFIYLYVTHLILSGPPCTSSNEEQQNFLQNKSEFDNSRNFVPWMTVITR